MTRQTVNRILARLKRFAADRDEINARLDNMENDMNTTRDQFDAQLTELETSVIQDGQIAQKVMDITLALKTTVDTLQTTVSDLTAKLEAAGSGIDLSGEASRIATIKSELDAAVAKGEDLIKANTKVTPEPLPEPLPLPTPITPVTPVTPFTPVTPITTTASIMSPTPVTPTPVTPVTPVTSVADMSEPGVTEIG